MRKLSLLIINIFLLYNFSLSQYGKFASKMQSLDIMYSQKVFQADLYDQVNTYGNYDFGKSFNYIGIGYIGPMVVNEKYYISGYNSYSMLIPGNITVADTIQGKMTGFNVGVSVFGIDLLYKYKNADLLVFGGFNTGRLRMYDNDLIRQKNPYFSPKIAFCPRVMIGSVTLSLSVEYECDVSKSGWRRTLIAPKNGINIQNFRQSGFTSSFTIGIKVFTHNSPVPPVYEEDEEYNGEETE